MTRSHATVQTLARLFTGHMLMWSTLACTLVPTSLAAQDRQPFAADTAAQALLMARRSSSVTQLLIDEESAAPRFDEIHLPPNLVVAGSLRQTLEAMLRDSPTFRRQCARLTNASSITINVVIMAGSARSQGVTDFSVERNGRMFARVQLNQRADREEVLAHEFEHIIEQLDGVDLRSLARRATAGVRLTEDADRFETERAVAIGRQVAQELRNARRKQM